VCYIPRLVGTWRIYRWPFFLFRQ